MVVYIEKYDCLVLKDKYDFIDYLCSGKLKQTLIYLQKEELFIHRKNWFQTLISDVH
ncbi:MAG: hypothetical protein J7L94_00020 [Caldisericaceae bacterium]|nr:hypothetical protein [Caldisericaceae bacterium]